MGLALVFALQVVGLCFCLPPVVAEHDCCPRGDASTDGVSAALVARADCCPEGPGLRAILRGDETGPSTGMRFTQAVVTSLPRYDEVRSHGGLVRPLRCAAAVSRSPILRI